MAQAFFEQPILNSPYEEPTRHHALDEVSGQPLDVPPIKGRRRSALISPVPPAKRKGKRAQQEDLFAAEDEEQQNVTLSIINEIRGHVTAWRQLKNPADWGVTPVTQRLLQYWRSHEFESVRPFFCQVEAVGDKETMLLFRNFRKTVLQNFDDYQIPVIALDRTTSKEAVCLVFEKVNTGGKPLDAFELVTAMYAADGFELRKDWFAREARLKGEFKVLAKLANTEFLQAISLLHTKARRLWRPVFRDGCRDRAAA